MLSKISSKVFSEKKKILHPTTFNFRQHEMPPSTRGIIQKEHQRPHGGKSQLAFMVLKKVMTRKAPKYRHNELQNQKIKKPMLKESDVLADYYLENCISPGAYTDSFGVKAIRQNIAEFLTLRDDTPCNYENIRLGDSIFDDMKQIGLMISHDKQNCFILPDNRTSEMYSGIEDLKSPMSVFDCSPTSFKETMQNIKGAVSKALENGLKPSVIYINNPGDFGSIDQNENDLNTFVEFCFENNLMILANESLQSLAFPDKPFLSLKRIIKNHQNPDLRDNLELISGFALNRNIVPEWTRSGGFVEFLNIEPFAMVQIVKMMSMMLASSTVSQITLDLLLTTHLKTDLLSKEVRESVQELSQENRVKMQTAKLMLSQLYSGLEGVTVQDLPEKNAFLVELDKDKKLTSRANYLLTRLLKGSEENQMIRNRVVVFNGETVGHPDKYKIVVAADKIDRECPAV